MKTNNHIKVLCVLAFAGSVLTAGAQEDKTKEKELNRQMTLEREFDPTVQDANKVNTLPEVKEPVVKKIPIDYATYTIATNPGKEITVLPSGKINTDILYNKRRGYFNFGAGTYLNINGDFGYHILSTEKDKLNVWFSHRSTNGKNKYLQIDEKIKVKLNDNLGGLNFSHLFNKATLNLSAKYGYSSFNYYGLPSLESMSSNLYDEQLRGIDRKKNQGAQTFQLNFGMAARQEEGFLYKFNIGYTNFSRKHGTYADMDGLKQNSVSADYDFSAGFNGDMRIGLEGNVSYFNYSIPNYNGKDVYSYDNTTNFIVAPYFKVEGDSWNLKLGAKAMLAVNDDSKFAFSPNIAADVEVADKTQLYFKADGNLQSNSAWEVSRFNRYVNPIEGAVSSRNYLDGIVGLKSGVASGFWFDIFGGYNITKDDIFFIAPVLVSNGDPGFFNGSEIFQANSDRFFAGANLKYSYQELFEIGLKGQYNHWKVKYKDPIDSDVKDPKAFGKPEMEITANVTVRPIKNLSASLDYYLGTSRYSNIIKSASNDYEKMKNINELNLTGNYNFNDTFGLYLKLTNVLFQKYDIYYGYPAQSFGAMIGVNINF